MTSFSDNGHDFQRLDYGLLQNGAVTLYWRRAYLEEDLSWLEAHGYRVHRLDASGWESEVAMHAAIARELGLPAYYGRNLDALRDSLTDLNVPIEGGMAVVLDNFDTFAKRLRETAQTVLDIAEHASRRYLLIGRRFVLMVQSNDPQIEFGPLGAVAANWNRREWLNANRTNQAT
jgi:RNAse (barnase) inhibitor barstar